MILLRLIGINLYCLQTSIYNGLLKKGHSTFTWDAFNQSSGVYIIKAVSQEFSTSQKVMLLK